MDQLHKAMELLQSGLINEEEFKKLKIDLFFLISQDNLQKIGVVGQP
ncbi:MAG: hypothetical protein LBC39_07905 [Methanobrevibacter sp.]|jgi:hypothetical protein|nr:hypothetical protein [Candidatus Methanovirga aequatorialis]